MKKRLFSLITVAAMLILSAAPAAMAVNEETPATEIEVSFTADRVIAGEGEQIVYTASLSGIEDYRGFQTALKYDSSKLKLLSVEKLSGMEAADFSANTDVVGTVGLVCAFGETVSTSPMDLARITFEVKDIGSASDNGIADMYVTGTKVSVDGETYMNAEFTCTADEVYVHNGKHIVIDAQPMQKIAIPGEEITYSFSLPEVENFTGMQFELRYDSNVLEYKSVDKSSALETALVKDIRCTAAGVVRGMINYRSAFNGSGEMFRLTFTVREPSDAASDDILHPEIYFMPFVSDDYITYITGECDIYPSEPAQRVINLINIIGTVTLESKAAIELARSEYESLPGEIKERVTNYYILTAAEDKYEELYEAMPVFECILRNSEVEIVKNKPCDENLTLYIAQYDEEGVLVGINVNAVTKSEAFAFAKTDKTVRTRCYIWNELMQPYTDVEFKAE